MAQDPVKFRVVDIKAYTDATSLLDDWPETATQLRSPKYIFGQDDPIYVEVRNLGIDPDVAETFTDIVKVQSESGGVVELTLKETGPDTNIFDNITAAGELLYLSDVTGSGAGDEIEIVDEELLKFSLEIQPDSANYDSCYRVMVDRGEYASCGIDVFFHDATKFKSEMDKSRVSWYEVGYQNYSNTTGSDPAEPMKHFIKNAGLNGSDNLEADFLFYTSHGTANGDLYDNDSPGVKIMGACDIGNASDWNSDVEWIWADACKILNDSGGGCNAWDDALFGSPRPAHMILGYHWNVGGDQTGEIETFFDYSTENSTIVSSFYHACTDGWNDPGAIVEHKDNDGDKLKSVTRDTSSTSPKTSEVF